MKKTLTSLAVGALCAAALTTQAAVPTGVLQSFPTQPLAVDWSSLSVPGGAGAITTTVALDAAVLTNDVAIITNRLVLATGAAPGGNANAQWSQAGQYLVTRPTGNSYTILLARIQNTGATISGAFPVSYDLGFPSAFANEDPDIGGHHAYYSFTGVGDWAPVPELTQVAPVAGGISASLNLGTWNSGATLYLLWVDDNGAPGTDGSYSIDNFIIGTLPPPPVIVTQPVGVTNLVGRTVTLTVVASGSGLIYTWIKDGNPVDAGANPTAATASLVITNAAELDSGDYSVSISNPQGNVSSVVVKVDIRADGTPPVLLAARLGATALEIIAVSDEALCIDSGACGSDAQFSFNWEIVNPDNPLDTIGVDTIVVQNGTNIQFNLSTPTTPGSRYTVRVVDIGGGQSGVGDLYGNLIPGGTEVTTFPTATFQQGVNGYAGTQDAGIHSATADGPDGANTVINVDGADGGGVRQALLRFDDIFGSNPGQIPSGASIRGATLRLFQTDNGDLHRLHRMLTGWDQNSATWNVLVDGVVANDVDAVAAFDASGPGFNGNNININIDVTASVQAWANGQANNGWAFIPNGNDGWRWNTSESANPPALLVEYDIIPCVNPPSIVSQPPATASVNEGGNLSIAVGVNVGDTCPTVTYQWFKGVNPVAGQTSDTLSLVGALPSDAGVYRLQVTNPNGSVNSSTVTVSVGADLTRPVLTRAVGPNNTRVVLTFSKTLGANASQTARYTFSGGITVSAANVTNNVVTLTTSARPVGTSTLTITGVTDNRASANVIDPNPTTVNITTVSVVDAWNSTLSFNTNNLDGSADWTTTGGAGWESGNALFGTETSAGVVAIFPTPIATVIPPNTNTPADFVTAYFRKTVTLPALTAGQSLAIQHLIDDGAIFYLDGAEIGRLNMAAGAATYATKATTTGEAQLLSLPFSGSAGSHVLAVEVHQGGATTSSDILFGAQIVVVPTASPALSINHVGTNAVVTWNGDASWQLQAAGNVGGAYAPVAGNPFRRFTAPLTPASTNQFYRLNLIPQP